ncbi:MAG: TauD/TfdA family dioxygenase [Pseudomonadota bacterium]
MTTSTLAASPRAARRIARAFRSIRVVPSGAALGAEVDAGDLRLLDASRFAEIRAAWLEHEVIVFRGQQLDDAALRDLGARFGAFQLSNPLPSPAARGDLGTPASAVQAPRDPAFPMITIVSNIVERGVAIGGLGDGELAWHSDMNSFPVPPSATLLHAIEVPDGQGQTSFASLSSAFDTLDPEMAADLVQLSLHHDAGIDAAGLPRPGSSRVGDLRESPGHWHPLVTRHPETGRRVLFLGRRARAWLEGLDPASSDALLDGLWVHATRARHVWTHRWRAGDLVVWDNRSVVHRREAFDPSVRRHLRRVVIAGAAAPQAALG